MHAITKEYIVACFNDVILSTLTGILSGSKASWRHSTLNGQMEEEVTKEELKYNVTFGDFD